MKQRNPLLDLGLSLLALWLLFGGQMQGCNVDWLPDLVTPSKPDAAVYVYEKDDGSVPPPVLAALSTLNKQGIAATTFEDDTVDGSGEVPDQYRVPLAAAKEAGLPSLVVSGGGKVIRVAKAPKTEAEVLEAAK